MALFISLSVVFPFPSLGKIILIILFIFQVMSGLHQISVCPCKQLYFYFVRNFSKFPNSHSTYLSNVLISFPRISILHFLANIFSCSTSVFKPSCTNAIDQYCHSCVHTIIRMHLTNLNKTHKKKLDKNYTRMQHALLNKS